MPGIEKQVTIKPLLRRSTHTPSHLRNDLFWMEEPSFRVFIRIPVPRPAGFVDPPTFVWNSEKETALWKAISRRTPGDINCNTPSSLQLRDPPSLLSISKVKSLDIC